METGIIIAIIGLLATPIAVMITYMLNRKKTNSELYEALSQSSLTAVTSMQASMTRLQMDLEKAIADLGIAQDNIDQLLQDNSLMKAAMRVLESQNSQLISENANLKTQISVVFESVSQMGAGSVILIKE